MNTPKKSGDLFLRVLSGAFVTFQKPKPGQAQVILKIAGDKCEDVVGLTFDSPAAIDSAIAALERCKHELAKANTLVVASDVH